MNMTAHPPKEAMTYLHSLGCVHVTMQSLATMRNRGTGPEFEYDGRYILYPEDGLLKWANKRRSRLCSSTSQLRSHAPVGYLQGKNGTSEGADVGDIGDSIDYRDPDRHFDEITTMLNQIGGRSEIYR